MHNSYVSFVLAAVFVLLISGFASAVSFAPGAGSSLNVNYETQPSFQTLYGSGQLSSYWPILADEAKQCQGRQDFVLQVAPGGCQPMVVRSDLLADQNVPVFCQIDAMQINPLVNVKEIKNIHFSGNYPSSVATTGFYPARAALRSRDQLLGSPLINNVGYAVIILKKTPNEKNLSDSVSVNLTAELEYDSGNAFGVGRSEFLLKEVSDDAWKIQKADYAFWQGRYFLRLDGADATTAQLSLYYGDQRVGSINAEIGKKSQTLYLPGMYCQAGVEAEYKGFESGLNMAKIEVTGDSGTDVYTVVDGSRFDNDKCTVSRISPSVEAKEFGTVQISCSGAKSFALQLSPRKDLAVNFATAKGGIVVPESYPSSTNPTYFIVDFSKEAPVGDLKMGVYGVDVGGNFYYLADKKENIGKMEQKLIRNSQGVTQADDAGNKESYYKTMHENLNNYRNFINNKPGEEKKTFLFDTPLPDATAEKEFNDAIVAYQKVATEHPYEKKSDAKGGEYYGEAALNAALTMIRTTNVRAYKPGTEEILLNMLVDLYPDSPSIASYKQQQESLVKTDSSLAINVVKINGVYKTVRLLKVEKPESEANASFIVNTGPPVPIKQGEYLKVGAVTSIRVEKIVGPEDVEISVYCDKIAANGIVTAEKFGIGTTRISKNDAPKEFCSTERIKVDSVSVSQVAKVILTPKASGTTTKTNLTITIGIEKRAIQLSTSKTKEMIKNLNESILRWEAISTKLTKVVTAMKGACFATSAVLMVKSFLSGLDGTTTARQQAMEGPNGWNEKCKKEVEAGTSGSMNLCFIKYKSTIDAEIVARRDTVNEVNKVIKDEIEVPGVKTEGTLFDQDSVDSQKAAKAMLEKLKTDFPNDERVQALQPADAKGRTAYTYQELRDMYFNLKLEQKSPALQAVGEKAVTDLSRNIADRQAALVERQTSESQKGLIGGFAASPAAKDSKPVDSQFFKIEGGKVGGMNTQGLGSLSDTDTTATGIQRNGKNYLFVGGYGPHGEFVPSKVYEYKENSGTAVLIPAKDLNGLDVSNNPSVIFTENKITSIQNVDRTTRYTTDMSETSRKVRFFGPGPFEGLPAIVPFDSVGKGWYAKVSPNVGGLGKEASYDKSALPNVWWICNVMSDGEVGPDDDCQQTNDRSTNILDQGDNSKRLIDDSRNALLAAAGQSGKSFVQIGKSKPMPVDGSPVALTDSAQCQNFMSITDCRILFNICDPVICPSSRCDLGGTYKVADVIQTGIIGGTLLCLPNVKEPIYVPFCLSGISAGVDGWVSVLKNHRDCLQESLNTGKMVGICDEIYSVYKCEFFWRQVAPFANAIIPKLIGMAYGQGGARGGGEYKNVQSAWAGVGKSMDFFTQTYAVNSFKVFQSRSVEQIGFELCRGTLSAVLPKGFKSLVEPESPPQFSAWFDSSKYSDVTVPATSEYKVFYHIYAGKTAGVSYSVYLKNPPTSSYVYTASSVQVATGFIAAGQYASETKDFTAPEGYQELCVLINNEEKCGFKKVTTSFAVNYASDMYAKDTLEQTGITGETECVSGSPELSLGALATNLNPQSALEEMAMPQDYKRGIVRVCSSKDPAATTEPGRYVDVGYCGDSNIRCWLDKNSVGNAISGANIGMVNATLKDLAAYQNSQFESKGFLTVDSANTQLADLEKEVKGVPASTSLVSFLAKTALVGTKIVLNPHKARLVLVEANAYDNVYLAQIKANPLALKLPELTATALATETYPDEFIVTFNDQSYRFRLAQTAVTKAYYQVIVGVDVPAETAPSFVVNFSRSTTAGTPYKVGDLYEYNKNNPPYFTGSSSDWDSGFKDAVQKAITTNAPSAVTAVAAINFALTDNYDTRGTGKNFIKLNGVSKEIYVIFDDATGKTVVRTQAIVNNDVGSIDTNGKIILTRSAKPKVDSYFGGAGYFDALNGKCVVPDSTEIKECPAAVGTGVQAGPAAGTTIQPGPAAGTVVEPIIFKELDVTIPNAPAGNKVFRANKGIFEYELYFAGDGFYFNSGGIYAKVATMTSSLTISVDQMALNNVHDQPLYDLISSLQGEKMSNLKFEAMAGSAATAPAATPAQTQVVSRVTGAESYLKEDKINFVMRFNSYVVEYGYAQNRWNFWEAGGSGWQTLESAGIGPFADMNPVAVEFTKSLKGKSFKDGMLMILERAKSDKVGGGYLKIMDRVTMGKDGVFMFEKGSWNKAAYFYFNGIGWQVAYEGTDWKSVSDVTIAEVSPARTRAEKIITVLKRRNLMGDYYGGLMVIFVASGTTNEGSANEKYYGNGWGMLNNLFPEDLSYILRLDRAYVRADSSRNFISIDDWKPSLFVVNGNLGWLAPSGGTFHSCGQVDVSGILRIPEAVDNSWWEIFSANDYSCKEELGGILSYTTADRKSGSLYTMLNGAEILEGGVISSKDYMALLKK